MMARIQELIAERDEIRGERDALQTALYGILIGQGMHKDLADEVIEVHKRLGRKHS